MVVFALALALMAGAALPALAQEGGAPPAPVAKATQQPKIPVEEIIQKFAAKESEFAKARENYTYKQTVRVQEIDDDGAARGKWEIVSDIIFSPEAKRIERVTFAPVTTLKHILITPEDEQDLRNVQPFVLTTKDLSKYTITYLGPQKVDEIEAYVFAVKPVKLEAGQRYFEGQVWVDQQDLQIVKSYGKGVGVRKKGNDNQFPRFETYRDQIDGKYWFPVYTRADDVLHFQDRDQRVRMMVKYEDYKQFKSQTGIQYGDVIEDGKATKDSKNSKDTKDTKKK
jgi:hypothetical protein